MKNRKKFEVCGVCISSKVVWKLGESEWEQILTIIQKSSNDEVKYAFTPFMKKVHMNERLYDTAHMFPKN